MESSYIISSVTPEPILYCIELQVPEQVSERTLSWNCYVNCSSGVKNKLLNSILKGLIEFFQYFLINSIRFFFMEKQFLRSLLLLPPSLECCHTPSFQPDRISATAPLSYSWWTTTPDETQLYYNSSCWQNTIRRIQRLGSPSRITATVLCWDAFAASCSLQNLCGICEPLCYPMIGITEQA